jgi:D-aminoacyl-tRNA deacylase
MLILFTSKNKASANIAGKLVEEHGFSKSGDSRWKTRAGGIELIDTKSETVLEVPVDFKTDCLIVLSTHRSKTPGKMLTTHVPGNWNEAKMGGEPRTLNIAPARILKRMLIELKKEGDRINWPVSLEADHHGPLSPVPIIFVEIGNGEEQWDDQEAARAVANAVAKVIETKTFHEQETAFAVGGGHYPRTFTRIMLETDIAIGHVLPKYAIDDFDEAMFRQAIEKSVEKVDVVLIAKDEVNATQRKKITEMCDKYDIEARLV